MIYLVSFVKAALLAASLHVGDPALCPYQLGDSHADEELNCEVLAVSTQAKVVVLVERAR